MARGGQTREREKEVEMQEKRRMYKRDGKEERGRSERTPEGASSNKKKNTEKKRTERRGKEREREEGSPGELRASARAYATITLAAG